MLIYESSTGTFFREDLTAVASGCYAGFGEYKNRPEFQNVLDRGPIVEGVYYASPVHDVPHFGPCMALTPDDETQKFIVSLGRTGGFLIHLDNPAHVGASSDGCIVPPSYTALLAINQALTASGNNRIEVKAHAQRQQMASV